MKKKQKKLQKYKNENKHIINIKVKQQKIMTSKNLKLNLTRWKNS